MVGLEEVEDWLRRIPTFRAHLVSEKRFREAAISFEIWTTGTFSAGALGLLAREKPKRTKTPIDWKDGGQVAEIAKGIEPPYRWRDWAAKTEGGITGPELLAFINQDEAVRPDGKRGLGLFAYLRSLQSANGDRRDIIAKVFEGTVNRMVSGYLLRDVINKINEIHFTSQDESRSSPAAATRASVKARAAPTF